MVTVFASYTLPLHYDALYEILDSLHVACSWLESYTHQVVFLATVQDLELLLLRRIDTKAV